MSAETIAAILAANTPLKAARYAVDNPPAADIARLLDQAIANHDTIEGLRAELTTLTHAALLAYCVIDELMSSYDEDSGPPPPYVSEAYQALFEALGMADVPSQEPSDELPF